MSTEYKDEVARLNAIKNRIRTNLVAQGITVPEDTMLDAMAEQILSVAGISPKVTLAEFSNSAGSGVNINVNNGDGTGNALPIYNGKNGTSVTVSSVSESFEDGGSNVVNFSDGNKLTVKNGKAGSPGYSPVRGTDYWTEADQADIVQQVLLALGGNPIFGVVDEKNNIIVSGDLADGSYTVKYELSDGSTVNIGNLVLDSNVYYNVTNNLTNCVTSNTATQAIGGQSYAATITAKSGYELKSMTVTMGGNPVTVSGGVIDIDVVDGDIVITAVAEEIQTGPTYTNKFVLGGDGYILNGRCSSTGADRTDANGCFVSNYIKISNGDTVYVNIPVGTQYSGFKLSNGNTDAAMIPSDTTKIKDYSVTNGITRFTINIANVEYIRIQLVLNNSNSAITNDDVENAGVIITVNEPIV